MVKKRSSKDLDSQVVFETPIANLKGGWLELIKQQYINCGNALLNNPDNPNTFHFSFLLLLNMLPGGKRGKIRHEIYNEFLALREKRLNEAGTNLSVAERQKILQEVDLEMIGKITDNVDMYIGIHEKLVVDVVGR